MINNAAAQQTHFFILQPLHRMRYWLPDAEGL
jgi:hypothetical protein